MEDHIAKLNVYLTNQQSVISDICKKTETMWSGLDRYIEEKLDLLATDINAALILPLKNKINRIEEKSSPSELIMNFPQFC